nr:unnamed protein product [Callosobruchus analis]
MEFFGLTSYGFSDPIKDMMRDDYTEPKSPPINILEVSDKKGGDFFQSIKELDCYIGYADGYAYRSWERLQKMKRKYVVKPVGPVDMYKYPGVCSMQYGWWNSDPLLAEDKWYLPREKHPMTTSEISRYVTHCLAVDKGFKF